MDAANSNDSRKQRSGSASTKILSPSCRQLDCVQETKEITRKLPQKNARQPINVRCNTQVKLRQLSQLHSSAAAGAAVAKPTMQAQSATKKMALKEKINQRICKKTADAGGAPLELLVVGHQVNMHPLHMPISMSTTRHRTVSARNKSKNVHVNFVSQWHPGYNRQGQTTDNSMHILEDGEFVYIYETSSMASQSWPTQCELTNEFNLLQHPLSVIQVVDSRFLAELIDELLTRY